jgi:hypothetical protein
MGLFELYHNIFYSDALFFISTGTFFILWYCSDLYLNLFHYVTLFWSLPFVSVETLLQLWFCFEIYVHTFLFLVLPKGLACIQSMFIYYIVVESNLVKLDIKMYIEYGPWINNNAFATSMDLDQPSNPRSLIRDPCCSLSISLLVIWSQTHYVGFVMARLKFFIVNVVN